MTYLTRLVQVIAGGNLILTEIMKSSKKISILLLITMGLTLLPVCLSATYDVNLFFGDDPCESSRAEACDESACGSEPNPGDDDCCDEGCRLCSLPCCTGTVMLPILAQGLAPALTTDGRMAITATDLPRGDADPLDHPPRG